MSTSASEVQRERLHNEKETEIMCCKTGGEILTRAASQENVLGDMISFCAGSVRIGAGDGKASSRRLSFAHGDGGALCAHVLTLCSLHSCNSPAFGFTAFFHCHFHIFTLCSFH